ncbi:hypothetical protein J2S19_001067 [Metabacillus malikii]|uniref:Uncharacterized protein n=1 Tax=Metabacillus malikii TaxID=1504265 RepID=A0ABT9ZCS8_9BACI|nr:hypothetical protein [Metabacillus malikii]
MGFIESVKNISLRSNIQIGLHRRYEEHFSSL